MGVLPQSRIRAPDPARYPAVWDEPAAGVRGTGRSAGEGAGVGAPFPYPAWDVVVWSAGDRTAVSAGSVTYPQRVGEDCRRQRTVIWGRTHGVWHGGVSRAGGFCAQAGYG